MDILINILSASWDIYFESAIYLIFGFIMSGLLYAWVSPKHITGHLGKSDILSVIKATFVGIPLPLCSCGVVPTALSLRRSKASKGATLSFLISTPETGVDSIAISYALLGPIYAIIRPIAAIITALIAGIASNFFLKDDLTTTATESVVTCGVCGLLPGNQQTCPHAFLERMGSAFRFAFGEFLHELAKWLLLGFLVAGIIQAVIPATFFANYMGSGFLSMIIMLIISIPIYICASSSTPIAAALLFQGVGPGAVLVFLLAGPATNAATFTMVWRFLGKGALVLYLLSIAIITILIGYVFETVMVTQGINLQEYAYSAGEWMPIWIKWTGALIFAPLIIYSLARDIFRGNKQNDSCCK